MANLTDVTNVTDRVLDIFLRSKGGEDNISCEELTVTERGQLADLHPDVGQHRHDRPLLQLPGLLDCGRPLGFARGRP